MSVRLVDRLRRQSLVRSDEASPAENVRFGRAVVPAVVSNSRECSYDRALLSVDTSMLCACRGTARAVRGRYRVRRDHDLLGSAGKAGVGGEPPAR